MQKGLHCRKKRKAQELRRQNLEKKRPSPGGVVQDKGPRDLSVPPHRAEQSKG